MLKLSESEPISLTVALALPFNIDNPYHPKGGVSTLTPGAPNLANATKGETPTVFNTPVSTLRPLP